jgi:hypothetical protein
MSAPSSAVRMAESTVLLTNEHGAILHANRAAGRLLRDGGPIQSAQGILGAIAPSAASERHSLSPLRARTRRALANPCWRSASPSPM